MRACPLRMKCSCANLSVRPTMASHSAGFSLAPHAPQTGDEMSQGMTCSMGMSPTPTDRGRTRASASVSLSRPYLRASRWRSVSRSRSSRWQTLRTRRTTRTGAKSPSHRAQPLITPGVQRARRPLGRAEARANNFVDRQWNGPTFLTPQRVR